MEINYVTHSTLMTLGSLLYCVNSVQFNKNISDLYGVYMRELYREKTSYIFQLDKHYTIKILCSIMCGSLAL